MTIESTKTIVVACSLGDSGETGLGSFTDNNDGTVTDKRTGLMWMRISEGQDWLVGRSTGQAKRFYLDEAQAICSNFAGHEDWRLPTLDELNSIVESTHTNPAANPYVFVGFDQTPTPLFWTSTNASEKQWWYVSFYSGAKFPCGPRENRLSVRWVRNPTPVAQITATSSTKLMKEFDASRTRVVDETNLSMLGTQHPQEPLVQINASSSDCNPQGRAVTALNSQFVDNSDGTVTDMISGLMWKRIAEGQQWAAGHGISKEKWFTFASAQTLAIGRVFAGHNDWRLPTETELTAIVCSIQNNPLALSLFCKTVNPLFWTSTTTTDNGAVCVSYASGKSWASNRLDECAVCLVRDTPLSDSAISSAGAICTGMDDELMPRAVEYFLHASKSGAGYGTVATSPQSDKYAIGTSVDLTATPHAGSFFAGWSGDVTRLEQSCTVVMDSNKSLIANFSLLAFPLVTKTSGSGTGTITPNLTADTYNYGSTITLTARAADGSIFDGWSGDSTGLGAVCTINIDSAKTVTGKFSKLDISDLEIGTSFGTVEHGDMKSGDSAFIIYISITNKASKQIHLNLPLSKYVTCIGEEIEQDAWLNGLINGGHGATIRAGAFRKVGLIFFKSKLSGINTGDHLYVTVSLSRLSRKFDFCFRCTDHVLRAFKLITSAAGDEQAEEEAVVSLPSLEMSGILERLELLEVGLSEALRKLETLQLPQATTFSGTAPSRLEPAQTLLQVLEWLATQDRIPLSALRSRLLPLDLLPSAVIDEINERALDLNGEPAIEDHNDEILVVSGIFNEVLVGWRKSLARTESEL
jgi:hypothetical protein